ncbi:NAD-binding protein [Phellopilus nigrolimitatus]|nr:NAD-binding protein [Phellopilus nigrolimitatus]
MPVLVRPNCTEIPTSQETTMSKSTVLILGATGNTGSSIVNALLESSSFNVIAAIRPSSASKPTVEELKSRGVEIRIVDLEHASPDQLAEALRGVETVISTIIYYEIHLQRPLIDASKKAGVKRFIPCDWGTACVPGVREMYDQKLGIRDYVKEKGLGYTFVDVGWWLQVGLPILDPTKTAFPAFMDITKIIYHTGNVKNAVTDLRDIGKFVERIILDPRTQNRYVFCWTEEITQNEVFALAKRISGKDIETVHISEEDLLARARDAEGIMKPIMEYAVSVFIRGDNIVENAKKEEYGGALDARELYPDLKLRSVEDYAKELYLN